MVVVSQRIAAFLVYASPLSVSVKDPVAAFSRHWQFERGFLLDVQEPDGACGRYKYF